MSEMPRMVSLTPEIIEAIPASEYNDMFIIGLKLVTNDDLSQMIAARLQNYNYDTKKLAPGSHTDYSLVIPNLAEEAVRVPMLAQTMGLLVFVTGMLYQEKELARFIQEATDAGQSTVDLDAQLLTVRQTLGVV